MYVKAQNQSSDPRRRLTVWYDGACPLCVREIALMRRLAPGEQVRFIDILEEPAACPLSPEAMLARFHAQDRDGRMYSGAAAFAALWRVIPILRPFGLAARNPAILALLERAYTFFLRVRPALQRRARALFGPVR
jgi:predicted DCC family thiol-disulfide oxidoreductase YuxK